MLLAYTHPIHSLSCTHKCHQVRGPKWNCLKLHLYTPLLNAPPHTLSLIQYSTHIYTTGMRFNFYRPGPLCLLMEEGGKEGWEHRDSSIVRLPPGCATGTWTQFNRTRSTAATKVPKSPRLKNWGILSITRIDWYTSTKPVASNSDTHTHTEFNLSVCTHACEHESESLIRGAW